MTYRILKRNTYIGLILLDFIGILFSFYLAYVLRRHLPQESYYLPERPYFILSLILGILYVFILHGAETQKKHPFESFSIEAWMVASSLSKGTIIFMAVSFLYRGFSISRLIVIFHLLIAIIIVSVVRLLWRFIVTYPSISHNAKRRILILVPKNRDLSSLKESVSTVSHETKLYFQIEPDTQNSLAVLESKIIENDIDCLEIHEKDFNSEYMFNVALFVSKIGIDLRVKPDLIGLVPLKFTLEQSGSEYYWTAGKGLREMYPRILKRFFDISFAMLVFIIFLLPGLIIALIITLTSPGEIFYRHQRIGVGGKKFNVLKFRTMYVDAEKRLKRNPKLYADFLKGYKLKNDPRITSIGSFLRRTSLDELPQIINILLGEMSFVGPRPVVEDELPRYGKFKDLLMSVPPGLTGLWQVSGRSDLTYEERVRLDLYYIENWSLAFDYTIIARTLPALIFGKGAY